MIDIVEKWAEDNKIKINKNKSGIMIHGYKGKQAKQDKGYIREYPYKT